MGGRVVVRTVATLMGASALSLALTTASGTTAECSVSRGAAPSLHLVVPPPQPQVRTSLVDPATVTAGVQAISSRAAVGMVVWDRATRDTLVSSVADQQFRSASLVKLLIAIDALASADPAPDSALAQKVERMLRVSNDSDASILWGQRGGAELVSRNARLLGLTGAAAPDIPGRWGNTLLTANDLLTVYRQLLESLPHGAAVLSALRSAPRLAADGFDQHFGIPTAFAGHPWAVKQGWGNSSTDVFVHTTGLVGAGDRYVVVLLTSHPRGTPLRTAAASVTAGATVLADVLPLA